MSKIHHNYVVVDKIGDTYTHVCSVCGRKITSQSGRVVGGNCKAPPNKAPGVRNVARKPREVEYFDIGD